MNDSLSQRIFDRIEPSWLTPSQKAVWEQIQNFDGPPYLVINIYGEEGVGKTFFAHFLQQQQYATYRVWPDTRKPLHQRLSLDEMTSEREKARSIRPLVQKYAIQQIILFSRTRVSERDMPAFELKLTPDDFERFRANFWRYLNEVVPEGNFPNFKAALEQLS